MFLVSSVLSFAMSVRCFCARESGSDRGLLRRGYEVLGRFSCVLESVLGIRRVGLHPSSSGRCSFLALKKSIDKASVCRDRVCPDLRGPISVQLEGAHAWSWRHRDWMRSC
ncbi:hypothetical protein LX36DRAFT_93284 [Colletotrichum falcatum]|nr:hypothetical protein LX36DRAFT_93284 [Colletotrichum falcatum]